MDGFFITIDCSEIYHVAESYKIFIDKNKMSIVYELKEWIRFLLNINHCFVLIHENSVIHELEEIKVLEILKDLKLGHCKGPFMCFHKDMENNLLSKLNLFTDWNGVKVHKLFLARCSDLVKKVSQNQQNHVNTNDKTDVNEIREEQVTIEKQLSLKDIDFSKCDKNANVDETETMRNFSSYTRSSGFSNTYNKLNFLPGTSTSNSLVNEEQKFQSETKKNFIGRKNRRVGIPFSLGALLSEIREKARVEKGKEKPKSDKMEESSTSCSDGKNAEEKNLSKKKSYMNSDISLKRKRRRRRHKKQNLKVNLNRDQANLSWDYYESPVSAKPNHIRFKDTDEPVDIEMTESNSNHVEKKLPDFNSLNGLNNGTQPMISVQLMDESAPMIEHNESNKNSLLISEGETCEKCIDKNSADLNCAYQSDSGIEKKELDESTQNLSDLELLKQKIRDSRICKRFY